MTSRRPAGQIADVDVDSAPPGGAQAAALQWRVHAVQEQEAALRKALVLLTEWETNLSLREAAVQRREEAVSSEESLADERERSADSRENAQDERDLIADERDASADAREAVADERETLLTELEKLVDARARVAGGGIVSIHQRTLAAVGRSRARLASTSASLDRIEAALHRIDARDCREDQQIGREIAATKRGWDRRIAEGTDTPAEVRSALTRADRMLADADDITACG